MGCIHTLIEFIGGDYDGKFLDSNSVDPVERELVNLCLTHTQNGTLGRAFFASGMLWIESRISGAKNSSVLNPAAANTHAYRVAEKLEEGDEVLIRLKHEIRSKSKPSRGK